MKSEAQRMPRDVENVVLRVPSEIRHQLAEAAKRENVSQNQLINGFLFTALFVRRFEPQCGTPKNLERFFDVIDSALSREDSVAFGAFHKDDWEAILYCVRDFVKADLITVPQTRTEVDMPSTVAFTFRLTKAGKHQLPLLLRMLRPVFAGVSHDGAA